MMDLKLALRSLRRSPGFSAVIVLTLALGIGANTAIFSFFRGIVLRPLPYDEPRQIVLLKKEPGDLTEPMGVEIGLLAADYRELLPEVQSLQSLATYTLDAARVTGRERPDLAVGAIVTHNFFTVLGSRAGVGRVFTEADRTNASGRLAVISHSYWKNHFGGDATALGQTVRLNQVPFTIVGVMPADFQFPREAQFWVTPANLVPENSINDADTDFNGRGTFLRTLLGRLKPGVSREQAERELVTLLDRLPNPNHAKRGSHLITMETQTVGEIRPILSLLLGCAGLVLLVACLNVANLTLTRSTTRQREVLVRYMLGGSRWQLARQMVAESLVLALLGGTAGVVLCHTALDLLVNAAPENLPRLSEVAVDGAVLLFALGLSTCTGLVCGLAPLVGSGRVDLAAGARAAGERGGTASAGARRLRFFLVVGEVALSLVLLVAAGMLVRSLWKLQAVPWGFEPSQVVSGRVAFSDERYSTPATQRQFHRALLDQLSRVPGFDHVSTGFDRIGRSWVHLPYQPEGESYAAESDRPQTSVHFISPDYLATLRIPLLQGRAFTSTDDENAPKVVLIDNAIARRHFPEGDAVGRRIQMPWYPPGEWAEVVGVVSSVKSDGPLGPDRPDIYLPYLQEPLNNFFVHVRTSHEPQTAARLLEAAVHQIDSTLPVAELATMTDLVAQPAAARRFPLGILTGFAGLALLLAGLGIYGVTAYGVSQRTRELGVRLALGALPRDVVTLVLRQGARPILIGLLIGLTLSLIVGHTMQALLFGIDPIDWPTLAAGSVGLSLLAAVACWLPARRATRIDPIIALRTE